MIVDGQIHGGVAQGIANALLEEIVYDDTGNILTVTLADFLPPTMHEIPPIEIHHLETPTEASVTRAKGVGEGGTIGAPAAVLNAINDALRPLGAEIDEVPATPARIHAALRAARRAMRLRLVVNGTPHEIDVEPRRTLADALRQDCRLTGTRIGCEHGVCGACTVVVDGAAVRSCLMFAVQAEGCAIRTIEGLAGEGLTGIELHPLQQAFIDHHGLQCGFCTAGFLMLAVAALEQYPEIDDENLREILASNLCRCTGYQNILKAVRTLTRRAQPG